MDVLSKEQTRLIVKNLYLFLLLSFCTAASFAQPTISAADLKILYKKEDSLKVLAKSFLTDEATEDRMRKDSVFIKTLIRGLQVKNSFYFPFDSVQGVSHLYAPDSTFRLFTWQLNYQNDYAFSRQRGAIQFRTADGSLRLIALKDYSEFADNPVDSARTKNTWIGAVYYNIIETSYNNKNYYTLFGIDANSYRTNKKWIDVLTFDTQGQPIFGAQPFFVFEKDEAKRKPQRRFSIEYKKDASTTMNFDEDLKSILVDHLISESNEPEYPWTFVPDGDYEGFTWTDGRWKYVPKIFTEKIDMKGVDPLLGNPPVEDPILDKDGNHNTQKLEERNKKNTGKKDEKPAPVKPVKKG